jgi:hypothetical protein
VDTFNKRATSVEIDKRRELAAELHRKQFSVDYIAFVLNSCSSTIHKDLAKVSFKRRRTIPVIDPPKPWSDQDKIAWRGVTIKREVKPAADVVTKALDSFAALLGRNYRNAFAHRINSATTEDDKEWLVATKSKIDSTIDILATLDSILNDDVCRQRMACDPDGRDDLKCT